MSYKLDPTETLIRQNCASILARHTAQPTATGLRHTLTGGFNCKICGKKFATFQALGGHVSSHAKHTLSGEDAAKAAVYVGVSAFPARNWKVHQCSTCKISFPTGQALGGHMRRHYVLSEKRKRKNGSDAGEKNKIQKIAFLDDVKEEPDDVKTVSFSGISDNENEKRGLLFDLNFPPVESSV